MAGRKIVYTVTLDGREAAVIDYLRCEAGTRDKATALRSLIWDAGSKVGILTPGDVRDLATLDGRERKVNGEI